MYPLASCLRLAPLRVVVIGGVLGIKPVSMSLSSPNRLSKDVSLTGGGVESASLPLIKATQHPDIFRFVSKALITDQQKQQIDETYQSKI